ncbi:glycosyltransferase [Larkinella sp.]|uniref:glycosyltransferase n=1 Tax=Larkinella sp. TaxID=2034517 RepID=UPI003BA9DFA2
MKQKKVLFFEAYPFFSGAQRVSLNLCKILKRNNYHITLLLADDSKNEISKNFSPYVDEIIKLKTSERLLSYGNFGQWFRLSVIFETLFTGLFPFYWSCIKIFTKGKFDFFYFCDPRGAVMLKIPLLFFRGKKIMYLQSKNRVSPFLSKLLFFSFIDHVISPSIDVQNSLPDSRKKSVINYGIDFSQYESVDSGNVKIELQNLLGESYQNRTKLLYAGLIKPQKGLHHLIYALNCLKSSIPEADLPIIIILGNPSNDAEVNFKNELLEFSVKHNLNQYIHWMGWQSNVLEWMKNVDYFIFPTIDKEMSTFSGYDGVIESTEGSPVVLIESSVCGLFSIASRVTGVTETIIEKVNGITYDPNKSDSLYEALKYISIEKPKFLGFPNKQKFTLESFSNKFLELFDYTPYSTSSAIKNESSELTSSPFSAVNQ